MSRAHRSLWLLIAVTVLSAGLVAQALAAPAGRGTDIVLAASTILLASSAALLVRVLHRLTPATAARHPGPPRSGHDDGAGPAGNSVS